MENNRVERARLADAEAIARLHRETITEGFLSKLGVGFLSSLYRYIIRREKVFVYRENDRVLGFVSFSEDVKGMIRRFAMRSPTSIVRIGFILLKRPYLLFPMMETVRATLVSFFRNGKRMGEKAKGRKGEKAGFLPESELLSLAVNPEVQGAGIGSELLVNLENYLRGAKVYHYKVIVGQSLVSANAFYVKHGFEFSQEIKIHGRSWSNVYLKGVKVEEAKSRRGKGSE